MPAHAVGAAGNPGQETVRRGQVDARTLIPASEVLQQLHDDAPAGHFTLGWLMSGLQKRSFGIIMLLLAVVAVAPGVSLVAGLLLIIPAFQMIAGHTAPVFPRRIADRPLPTLHLAAAIQRAVPVLRYLERAIHPRWPPPYETTKRVVGIIVTLLSTTLILIPVPLSNVIPALVIALISLAYLEEDGLVLLIALAAGLAVLGVGAEAAWQTIVGTEWLSRFL